MNLTTILYCIDVRGINCYREFVFLITGVAVKNTFVTRRVLSETKAIMSPPVCHWMESNFFVEGGEIVN